MGSDKKKKHIEKIESYLTRIKVRGYKSLVSSSEISIGPLTILAGSNNSGKSSIMQPLLLLKQTLDDPINRGPLKLSGPNVEFTSHEQLLSRLPSKPPASDLMIEMERSEEDLPTETISFHFSDRLENKIDIMRMEVWPNGANPFTVYAHENEQKNSPLFGKALDEFGPSVSTVHWNVSYDRFFLGLDLAVRLKENSESQMRYLRYGEGFKRILSRVIYVPSRGLPQRTYEMADLGFTKSYPVSNGEALSTEPKAQIIGPFFRGPFTAYFPQLIANWQNSKSVFLPRLNELLAELNLASEVQARVINGGSSIELRVVIGGKKSREKKLLERNLADVGFGVSQALPVLSALLVAEPGQLVYLEEPELHLHPSAQVAMAGILAAAAKRGVRVVAETHSSLLLLAIQTLVAEGKLSPELVKLHWFSLRRDGSTKIDSADLDEEGAFGDWPSDFSTVLLAAQRKYIDAGIKF